MTRCATPRALVSLGLVAFGVASLYFSCNKKAEDKAATTAGDDPTKAGQLAVSTNVLAATYPEGLSVTAFPEAKVDAVAAGQVAVATGTSLTQLLLSEPAGPMNLTVDNPNPNNSCIKMKDGVVQNPNVILAGQLDPSDPCSFTSTAPKPQNDFRPFEKPPQKKLAEARERIDGKAERCFSDDIMRALQFQAPEQERCYQFDYGIMKGQSCQSQEACMVSYSREVVGFAVSRVESALELMQAMLCQAQKDGEAKELPAVGKTLDLLQTLDASAKVDANRPTFTKAEITRLADQNGRPVYKTSIVLTAQDQEREITMAHSPTADGKNDEYQGMLWIKMPVKDASFQQVGAQGQVQQQQNQLVGKKNDVMSVKYSRGGSGDDLRVKMEVRSARISADRDAFTKTGEVDFNAGASFTAAPGSDQYGSFGPGGANDYVSSMAYFAFDINPNSSEGGIAFWRNPGGNFYEPARGFVFNVGLNAETGYLEGCAVAGAATGTSNIGPGGISIRRSIVDTEATLIPRGYFTPMVCDDTGNNAGSTVWKQCFKQTDGGVYVLDETKTSAVPGFDRREATATEITVPDISKVESLGDVNM